MINTNIAASLVDGSLDGTWVRVRVSLFVVFASNLKLHHLLYADIAKLHKVMIRHHRSKNSTLGGKEHNVLGAIWFLHRVSQLNVTRIVGLKQSDLRNKYY